MAIYLNYFCLLSNGHQKGERQGQMFDKQFTQFPFASSSSDHQEETEVDVSPPGMSVIPQARTLPMGHWECWSGNIFYMKSLNTLADVLLCTEEAAQWKAAEDHSRHSLLVKTRSLKAFFFTPPGTVKVLVFNI